MAHREYTEYFKTLEEAQKWESKFHADNVIDQYITRTAYKSNDVVFRSNDGTTEPAYTVKWEKYT